MKTRLTNLKRISNRQHPSAALAAGDVAFFALGQILHDRAFSAAAFLFEPVLVDCLLYTSDELDLDTDAVRSMYDLYDFSTEITDDDKEGFQKTADFMYESGMIDEAFDVKQLFIEK